MILTLNHKYELAYIESAKEIDREFNMNLTLTAERHGYHKGLHNGEARILMNQLKFKFNEIPDDYIEKINSADARTLEKWGINIMVAKSLEDVFKNN